MTSNPLDRIVFAQKVLLFAINLQNADRAVKA